MQDYSAGRRSVTQRMEDGLNGIAYLLQRDVFYSKLFYIAAAIQAMAVFSAAFAPQFAWSDRVVEGSGLRAILRVASLDALQVGESLFLILFAITMTMILAAAVLVAYMGHTLAHGSVPPLRVSRALQRLISLMTTFQGPIVSLLTMMSACGRGAHADDAAQWRSECTSSAGPAILFSLSLLGLIAFTVMVFLFSRMHSYNPVAFDSSSRPVTWIDALYSLVQISIAISFNLEENRTVALALFYFVSNSVMTALVIGLVPFYKQPMNSVRAALHTACAWTGACLVVVTIVDDPEDDVTSTAYLTGLLPAAVLGYRYSGQRARLLVKQGRRRAALLFKASGADLEDAKTDGGHGNGADSDTDDASETATRMTSATDTGAKHRPNAIELAPSAASSSSVAGRRAGRELEPLVSVIEYASLPDHVEHLAEESILETLGDSFGAYLAEVGTRFLVGVGRPDPSAVGAADLLYREALARYPRSEYLLMRYIDFLIIFKEDLIMANMLVSRCAGVQWESAETRFDVLRFAKELNRMRQASDAGGSAGSRGRSRQGMDAITHEEVVKALKRTRADHKTFKKSVDKTFNMLKNGKATLEKVTRTVEAQHALQERAIERFEFLLANAPNNQQVGLSFAAFVEDVLLDPMAAAELREDLKVSSHDGSQSAHSSSRAASSGYGSHVESAGRRARMDAIRATRTEVGMRLRRHAIKMRLVTALLLSAVVAVIVVYVLLFDRYEQDLMSVTDSSVRRALLTSIAADSRSLHLGILNGTDVAHRLSLRQKMLDNAAFVLWLHNRLVHDFAYKSDSQYEFYHSAGVPYRVATANPDQPYEDIYVTGADSIVRFVRDAQALAEAPVDDIAFFNASNPSSQASLFQVIHNSAPLLREMDTSVYLYQTDAQKQGELLMIGLLSAGCIAAVIELLIVFMVFRPAAQQEFAAVEKTIRPVLEIDQVVATTVMAVRKGARVNAAAAAGLDVDAEPEAVPALRRQGSSISASGSRARFSPDIVSSASRGPPSPRTPVHVTRVGRSRTSPASAPQIESPAPSPRRWNSRSGPEALMSGQGGPSSAASGRGISPPSKGSPRRLQFAAIASAGDGKPGDTDLEAEKAWRGRPRSGSNSVLRLEAAAKAVDAAGADNQTAKDSDAAAARRRKSNDRQRRVTIGYLTSLACIVGSLVAMTAFAAISTDNTIGAGVELNNAGRIRALLERSGMFARELFEPLARPGMVGTYSGGLLEDFVSPEAVVCQLRTASNTLTSVHFALLEGADTWAVDVPRETGWPAVEFDTNCSALTPVRAYFKPSIAMKGLRASSHRVDRVLYRNSCLSELDWDSGVAASSSPRLQPYIEMMAVDDCLLYDEGDVRAQQGLHTLLMTVAEAYRSVAKTVEDGITVDQGFAAVETIRRYHLGASNELQLGVLRLVLEIQADTQENLNRNTLTVILLVSAAALVVILQHVALSRQLGGIITQNVGMKMAVKRLLGYAVFCSARAVPPAGAACHDAGAADGVSVCGSEWESVANLDPEAVRCMGADADSDADTNSEFGSVVGDTVPRHATAAAAAGVLAVAGVLAAADVEETAPTSGVAPSDDESEADAQAAASAGGTDNVGAEEPAYQL